MSRFDPWEDEPITTPMRPPPGPEPAERPSRPSLWDLDWEQRRVLFALVLASSTLIFVMLASLVALTLNDR